MADLSPVEIRKLEKLFGMSDGYIRGFNSKSDFISFATLSLDISDTSGYDFDISRANILRVMWQRESNERVAKLLEDLLENLRIDYSIYAIGPLFEDCLKIPENLRSKGAINLENLQHLAENGERSFDILTREVRSSLKRNEPEVALDRLHTYMTVYARRLLDTYSIAYGDKEPLNSIFGKYVQHLHKSGRIKTKMTAKILKRNTEILEDFNSIRNDHSLAHGNELLSYEESALITDNILSLVGFVRHLENPLVQVDEEVDAELFQVSDDFPPEEDDLPF